MEGNQYTAASSLGRSRTVTVYTCSAVHGATEEVERASAVNFRRLQRFHRGLGDYGLFRGIGNHLLEDATQSSFVVLC